MDIREVATIQFVDRESGDEAVAIVRAGDGCVSVALSLRRNGDIQVVMQATECETLIEALQKAIVTAQTPKP